MRFPQAYLSRATMPVVAVAISGPVTTAQANGASLDSGLIGMAVAARVSATAFTNGLALSCQWQVLDDNGSTWINCIESQNPAIVALVTGNGTSGGTSVTTYVAAPPCVSAGNRQARLVVFATGSGPAKGVGFDYASIEYDIRQPVSVYGS